MAPPNPRVAKAFRAMRDIGITEEKVKPVLKKLLKLYDKNWELIEEENYRALADAIFDTEESEAAETKKKSANTEQEKNLEAEPEGHDEPERPLKRLRLRYRDSEASPSCGNTSSNLNGALLKKPKVEDSDLPETSSVSQSEGICQPSQPSTENTRTNSRPVSPQPHNRIREKQLVSPGPLLLKESSGPLRPGVMTRSQSNSVSSSMLPRDRGKEPPSPQVCNREKQSICERSSHPLHFKEPKTEPGIVLSPKEKAPKTHALIKPKDEPFTDDCLPQYQVPIAVIHPDSLAGGDSSMENGILREPAGPEPIGSGSGNGEIVTDGAAASSPEIRTNFEFSKIDDKSTANLEMASLSSPFGEVKFYLSCSSALGRSDFSMPTVDAVLQSMEKKWLRTYGMLDPSFSARSFVKDVCDCFVEVASNSTGNNLCAGDAPVAADGTSSVLNGLSSVQCDGEAASSQLSSLTPPCNDINGCLQLDKNNMGNGCQTDREPEKNGFEDTNPQTLMVVQHHEMNPNDIRCLHDVNDIAKGQERVIIPLANEINSESPPSFHYIPQNVVYQNAYVNFSLARIGENDCCLTCTGDCLSSSIPCACAHETGGEFAYNLEGLVKEEFLEECVSMNRDPQKHRLFYCEECPLEKSKNEEILEPCKGHLVRRFIKECWLKCGCSKQCGNRVVQRGIKRKLEVFMTHGGKGWGLRALENLPKGAFICEYVGEVLTNAELYDRISRNSSNEEHAYPVLLDADWNSEKVLKDEEALCLDATSYGNVARFINHRCFDSNLVEIPVEVETPDHHYYRLAFFTTRKVEALEELTWDYGIDFDDHDHPVKAFRCRCGSKFCRNIKRSSRSRSRR